jgi:Putative Actinobacterial Holin-X, holin superfamily III
MASVPTDHGPPRDASIADLLRSLLADVQLLVQREAQLARLELKDKGIRLGVATGMIAGAALVALFAFGTLIAAAVLGVALALPAWAAALIVGTLLVLVAVVLFLVGRARMRALGSLAPTETIETVREDVAWMRRETERLRSTE